MTRLTSGSVRRLQGYLRLRNALLAELRRYDPKQLAAEFGVSRMTIYRMEESMFGYRAAQPRGCELTNTREVA